MKTLFPLLFVTLALGACKDQAETQQGVRDSANPDGQQLRKKYEEAGKQAEERRKAE